MKLSPGETTTIALAILPMMKAKNDDNDRGQPLPPQDESVDARLRRTELAPDQDAAGTQLEAHTILQAASDTDDAQYRKPSSDKRWDEIAKADFLRVEASTG
eukprot:CAMPEP_0194035352 /NCGR_PEP_ID=MMETSP0009_2-20130614/7777_1 /TAXON_ID=210454 /ORGANISM="Grammatophora oceanica, Strain CCMP 410" /LENGTH=101 /DNA_ID=CAMNT_0038676671 /DNA_START=142 /DNA_END=444 /DNA_ORIENTATION=+